MRKRGEALGAEARGKGIHVLLAPTMNLARVAAGGRNFEASGADRECVSSRACRPLQTVLDSISDWRDCPRNHSGHSKSRRSSLRKVRSI